MKNLGIHLLTLFSLFCVLRALRPNEILIIVSYDAFRNEYFDRNVTDFTNALRMNSTRADYLRNVFPTKTYPNHHSIATGVFPEEHGVMMNSLYDFELGRELDYSSELFHFRSEIKPIWILNEQSGGTSGCMMWPGSDYLYDNFGCTHNKHFNMSENYKERVDDAMKWILDEKKPANLVMFYIEEPDTHAHAFGPESQTITDLVAKLDEVTEYFHQKIHEHQLTDRVNVVHLSDHGMDSLELRNVVDLKKIIGSNSVKFYGTTPILQIVPDYPADTTAIYKKLLDESSLKGKFRVYVNTSIPERWHFQNKYRVGPITAVADLGFGFQDMFDEAKWYEKEYKIPVTPTTKYGVHGYDNIYESMHPIFFAYGHLIKNENVVAPFDTVDLFYLFCEILELEPPSYLKGNRENILAILKDGGAKKLSRWMVLAVSVLASTVMLSVLLIVFSVFRRNRSYVPSYLYEEDTTILDDTKLPNYSINGSSTSSLPSTSFQVL